MSQAAELNHSYIIKYIIQLVFNSYTLHMSAHVPYPVVLLLELARDLLQPLIHYACQHMYHTLLFCYQSWPGICYSLLYTTHVSTCTIPCCFVIRVGQGSATASYTLHLSAHVPYPVVLLLELARDLLQPLIHYTCQHMYHTLLFCYQSWPGISYSLLYTTHVSTCTIPCCFVIRVGQGSATASYTLHCQHMYHTLLFCYQSWPGICYSLLYTTHVSTCTIPCCFVIRVGQGSAIASYTLHMSAHVPYPVVLLLELARDQLQPLIHYTCQHMYHTLLFCYQSWPGICYSLLYTTHVSTCTIPCCFVIRVGQGSATASYTLHMSAHVPYPVVLLLELARDLLQPLIHYTCQHMYHTLLFCYQSWPGICYSLLYTTHVSTWTIPFCFVIRVGQGSATASYTLHMSAHVPYPVALLLELARDQLQPLIHYTCQHMYHTLLFCYQSWPGICYSLLYTTHVSTCTIPCCFVIRVGQGSATASYTLHMSAHVPYPVALLLELARDLLQPLIHYTCQHMDLPCCFVIRVGQGSAIASFKDLSGITLANFKSFMTLARVALGKS